MGRGGRWSPARREDQGWGQDMRAKKDSANVECANVECASMGAVIEEAGNVKAEGTIRRLEKSMIPTPALHRP